MHRRVSPAILALALTACSQGPMVSGAATPAPLTIVKATGSGAARLTLSERAAQRLGIQTASVSSAASGSAKLSMPYAALIYDSSGATWTYTNPQGLTFVRAQVAVAQIRGDVALLKSGPAAGTRVVTVGNAELYGAETGVSGGH